MIRYKGAIVSAAPWRACLALLVVALSCQPAQTRNANSEAAGRAANAAVARDFAR